MNTYQLYDTSTEYALYSQRMTPLQAASFNAQLRREGSQCRWIPVVSR